MQNPASMTSGTSADKFVKNQVCMDRETAKMGLSSINESVLDKRQAMPKSDIKQIINFGLDKIQNDDEDNDVSSEEDILGGENHFISSNVRQLMDKAMKTTPRLGSAIKMHVYASAGPVCLVSLNEKNKGEIARARLIEEARQLFTFDDDFYKTDRNLVQFQQFEEISRAIYTDTESPYFVHVTAVTMHRFKSSTIVFVGNTRGFIRPFCLSTSQEWRPLSDPAS